MESVKELLKDGEGKGMLETKLFHLFSDLPLEDSCWDLFPRFIDFIQQYERQVKSGQVTERIMVAGIYEATEKVTAVNWQRMIEIVNRIKESKQLESDESLS